MAFSMALPANGWLANAAARDLETENSPARTVPAREGNNRIIYGLCLVVPQPTGWWISTPLTGPAKAPLDGMADHADARRQYTATHFGETATAMPSTGISSRSANTPITPHAVCIHPVRATRGPTLSPRHRSAQRTAPLPHRSPRCVMVLVDPKCITALIHPSEPGRQADDLALGLARGPAAAACAIRTRPAGGTDIALLIPGQQSSAALARNNR